MQKSYYKGYVSIEEPIDSKNDESGEITLSQACSNSYFGNSTLQRRTATPNAESVLKLSQNLQASIDCDLPSEPSIDL